MYDLLVGSNGQDGKILSNLLIEQGIDVILVSRNDILIQTKSIKKRIERNSNWFNIFSDLSIRNVFYLAAISRSSEHINKESSIEQLSTNSVDMFSIINTLLSSGSSPKLFYASSSLVFGNRDLDLVNEQTSRAPSCIYSKSKLIGEYICDSLTKDGIESYTGILFNHESSYRKSNFLFSKVIQTAIYAQKSNKQVELKLGDPTSKLDVGYAPEFIEAIISLINSSSPGSYIISTNTLFSISEIVDMILSNLGVKHLVYVNYESSNLIRPPRQIRGDNSKLESVLGWKPEIFGQDLVSRLVVDYQKENLFN